MVEPRIESWFQKIEADLLRRVGPGRGAARHDPPPLGRALQRRQPGRLPGRLDDHVHPALAGQRADLPRHVAGSVVDACGRRPAPARGRAWRRPTRSRSTVAPASLAMASAASATPPPIPWISTRLARRQPRPGDQHPPRGQERQAERARLRPRQVRRLGRERGRRHAHVLGERAVEVLAEDPEADAHRLLAAGAELALAAREAGVDHDLVARATTPSRPRRSRPPSPAPSAPPMCGSSIGHPGHAVQDEEIQMVQRRRLDPHDDLARGRRRLRPRAERELRRAAMAFEVQCPHRASLEGWIVPRGGPK